MKQMDRSTVLGGTHMHVTVEVSAWACSHDAASQPPAVGGTVTRSFLFDLSRVEQPIRLADREGVWPPRDEDEASLWNEVIGGYIMDIIRAQSEEMPDLFLIDPPDMTMDLGSIKGNLSPDAITIPLKQSRPS